MFAERACYEMRNQRQRCLIHGGQRVAGSDVDAAMARYAMRREEQE